jgi:hypothetical protein
MPFSAGFDATLSYAGTDISLFVKDVKFTPTRKETPLPTLGGGPVHNIVGPVTTMVDIQGWVHPTTSTLFNSKMAELVPTVGAVAFAPQGAAGPTHTCTAFCVSYDEHAPAEGAAEFTAKLAVDGLVTF